MTTSPYTNQLDQHKQLYTDSIRPAADIYETDTEYIIKLDMPGIKKEALDITLDKDILNIFGRMAMSQTEPKLKAIRNEFEWYNYFRAFRLDHDSINHQAIDAQLDNGVLTLRLQKSEQVKPRKIPITN